MFWYLVLLVALLFLGVLAHDSIVLRGREPAAVPLFACVLMFAFAALRASSIGADTANYEGVAAWVARYRFSQLAGLESSVWYLDDSDVGFRFYARLVMLFSDSPRAITVANSAITFGALYVAVRRYSPDAWLSCWLFYVLGLFQLSMNLAPSFMGVLVVACGFKHLASGDLVHYVPYVLVGSLFHPAMIFMLGVFFVVRIKLTQKRFFALLAVATAVALLFYPQLLGLLKGIVPSRYVTYFTSVTITPEKMLVWASHLVLFGLCWLAQEDRAAMFERNGALCWLFLLESVFYLLSSQSTGLGRVAYVFTPYLVITVPCLLQTAKDGRTAVGRQPQASARAKLVTGSVRPQARAVAGGAKLEGPASCDVSLGATKNAVMALAGAIYVARLFINNIGSTMPYLFFWM